MGLLLMAIGGLLYLVAAVCGIIILIAAFQDAIWKGIVGFFCGFYLLYFMFFEFEHEKKGLIIAGNLLGGILGYFLFRTGAGMLAGV